MLLVCPRCLAVLRLVIHESKSSDSVGEPPPPSVPPPKGIQVSHENMDLVIAQKWRVSEGIGWLLVGLPFSLLWSIFFLWATVNAVQYANWVGAILMGAAGVGGVVLTYYAVAGLINTTWVRLSPQSISVRHGPLPTPGSKQLATAGLSDAYIRQRSLRLDRNNAIDFPVMVIQSPGTRQIVFNAANLDIAWFVRQEIERFYRLASPAPD
jgi:hypothetical protein